MAGLLDLFSGRSSDIYGNGLLTPEQRGGLGNIGLLALAGKLGQLAGPSFSPVPDFGAALGQAAGAYGASQEGAGTAALNAILTGQKGRKLEQELDYYKQLGPVLSKLAGQWPGADGGAGGGGEGSGSTGGGAGTLTPGGALTGNPGSLAMAESPEIQEAVAHKLATTSGIQHWASFNPKLYNALQSAGLPTSGPLTEAQWQQANPLIKQYESAGGQNIPNYRFDAGHTAGGTHQITNSTWNSIGGPAIAASMRGAAAPTAAAPAGGGGLLAPTAPNPLSDAEPMVGIPRSAARQQAAAGPGDTGADLLAAGMSPEMVARYLARPAPGAGGRLPDGSLPLPARPWPMDLPGAGGGGPLAAPPGAGTDSYMTPQGPAGDVGPAGPAGPATPRAPLPTMGPAGIELPPMQGPLAAPAPAAAAPVAPGPGLLAAPGALPAAPALPRVNPAFDAYARQLAVAQGLATGAGLPNALGPLLEVFKGSPAYKAQQTIAEKTAAQPFEQAQTLFNKQVEIAGVGPIEAAKLPYALAQTYFKAEQDIRTAGPVAAAQNFERIRADNAAKGIITTMGADGQIKLSIDPDAVKAVTGATITAPEQAKADIARETTRIQQEQSSRYQPVPGGVPVMGADGKTTMMPMSQYEYDLRQRLQAERRGAGVPSSGPQPGDIVGTPYVSKEEEQSQQSDQKRLDTMQAAAQSSRLAIQNANDIRQLVEKGVVMGPGEDVRSGLLKLGYALHLTGKDENDLIANTETFISRQGAELKEALKGLGPPISNIDVQTAGGIAGGKNLTPQGLLELMQIKDKYHRQALNDYNQMAEKAPPSRYPRLILEPPTYGAQIIEGPNGHKMWNKNGKWVEF